MITSDQTMLCDELKRMLRIRMATVLVPALQIIEDGTDRDTTRVLRLYADAVGDQVESILEKYEVRLKDEHRDPENVRND